MENSRILADTSIIIEHLRKEDKKRSVLYNLMLKYEICISSVTEFELLAGATNKQKQSDIETVLGCFQIFPFSSEIASVAADIYQNLKSKNQLIEIRDIFIAATAEALNLPVATLNKNHFERIISLKLIS